MKASMWGAAPRRRRYRLVVLAAFLVGLTAGPAAARVDLGAQHVASPTELWVIGVDRHNVATLTDRFALRARRARVNALVRRNADHSIADYPCRSLDLLEALCKPRASWRAEASVKVLPGRRSDIAYPKPTFDRPSG